MNWIQRIFDLRGDTADANTQSEDEVLPEEAHGNEGIPGDNPITTKEDDTLGRAAPAYSFAHQVVTMDTSEGVVVGVMGAWGSGKTSFLNLTRAEFEALGVPVLDFNPWMFSGTEQLIESFFTEIADQLRLKPGLDEIAQQVEDYGEAFSSLSWLPVLGNVFKLGEGASKALNAYIQRRQGGIAGRRNRLKTALKSLKQPLVVIVDDIDRLTSAEIRDIFKLVRLTASFPNVIYLVAFDRARVEQAPGEQGVPGRDYLEKILQIAVDLPAVPPQVLLHQVTDAIVAATTDIDYRGPFDVDRWPDILMDIIRPLISNMRDVRRYAISVRWSLSSLDGNVASEDVLALEAIRVFLPDVYHQLHP